MGFAFAAWTRTDYTEPWDNVESPALLSHKGWNEKPALANFTYGHIGDLDVDGKGIRLNFTVQNIKGDRREWWWWEGTKRFYFALGLHGTNGSAYAMFYIAHEQGIVLRTSEAKVGTRLQYNVGKPLGTEVGETVDTENAEWCIQIIRLNSTMVKVVYATNLLTANEAFEQITSIKTFNETLTVDPSVFVDPELKLYVGHDGSGEFMVSFENPYVGNISAYEDQLPEGVVNPFPWITGALNYIYSLALIVGGFLNYFLPILPFIFLFYALDAIITSVQTGSIQPIGKFTLTIWEFLLKIWDVLARIAQVIWDAITFWT